MPSGMSTYKFELKIKEEKLCNYIKKGRKKKEKIIWVVHTEKYSSQEKENTNNYRKKTNNLNKNEIYKNDVNEYSENKKKEKNNKIIGKQRIKVNNIDNFKENKNISDNLNIKRKEKKYKNKFIRYYIISYYNIILNIILFSKFIKCNYRKIELASYQINLKINGTGKINIYSSSYRADKIIINDKINITGSNINYFYNFDGPDNYINNITLLWDRPLSSTSQLFKDHEYNRNWFI